MKKSKKILLIVSIVVILISCYVAYILMDKYNMRWAILIPFAEAFIFKLIGNNHKK